MEERRFPEAMPQPTDETYPVAPTVGHWSELTRPPWVEGESYDVGEEVAEAPFRVDAESWREIVSNSPAPPQPPAAHDAPAVDGDYGLGPKTAAIWARTAAAMGSKSEVFAYGRQVSDARIGKCTDSRRFTLRGLFLVSTLASVVFAVGARMPRGMFAGTAGLAVLLTAVGSRWLMGESAPAKVAWWTLMVVYLVTSLFALLGL